MPVRRLVGLAAVLAALLLLQGVLAIRPAWAEAVEAPPLRVALLPTNPPLSLLRLYDPFRQFLSHRLQRPVELYTARNFRTALDDIRRGDFDVLVTAPHFGVIAVDAGYVPLARYKVELRPLIVVLKGSSLTEAAQLRGKKVLTANRLTAMSVVTEHWLESQYGLVAGRDYQLIDAQSHGTAIRAVGMGDADACVSSVSALQQVPEDVRARVTFFEAGIAVPHQFTLAHPRLGERRIAELRQLMMDFNDTREGKAFFAAGGFQGYSSLTAKDIEDARPYADKVAKMIEDKP
ncbi:MAG TPA: phosphate/phosphite/phosphonate ABC transporter substrate-binding protein [Candidatus Sulfotelmatobacter sp.]|jgi:phosphonate transport system substrate-binding protein|nr:phosphate/phosphite/phosphonate ABC transporter substrate-binding protein [Candidatus Sulfotelmatobacter sp.]